MGEIAFSVLSRIERITCEPLAIPIRKSIYIINRTVNVTHYVSNVYSLCTMFFYLTLFSQKAKIISYPNLSGLKTEMFYNRAKQV